MATTYAGNPANYPTSITIPSDGDGPGIRAADVNVAFEGLADRTASVEARVSVHDAAYDWARPLRAFPGVNFTGYVDATSPGAFRYVPGQREWLVWNYSNNNALRVVSDVFDTWPSTDLLTDPAADALPTASADGDASGNRVVFYNADAISEFNGGTWTIVSSVFGNDPDRPCIAWEPVTGNWIAVARAVGALMLAATSTNRTAWTARTNPFPTLTFCTVEVDRAGTAVMAGYNGSTLYISRSTNGGVTWSAAVSFAVGFTIEREGSLWPRPVWSGDRWYVFASGTASTDVRIYTSTAGASWSLQTTLTSVAFSSLAAIGDVLVATSVTSGGGSPTVLVSADRGVTWRRLDRQFNNATGPVVANGSRFILGGSSRVYPSLAVNIGDSTVT